MFAASLSLPTSANDPVGANNSVVSEVAVAAPATVPTLSGSLLLALGITLTAVAILRMRM